MSGYKSIKDLECELQPGLNIIIGKNGSGKTNFMEMMDMCLGMKEPNTPQYYFSIDYFRRNEAILQTWIFQGESLETPNDIVQEPQSGTMDKKVHNIIYGYFKRPVFIRYSLPTEIPYLKDKVSIESIDNGMIKYNDKKDIGSSYLIYVIEDAASSISKYNYQLRQSKVELVSKDISHFQEQFEKCVNIFSNKLKQFTPIENIRPDNKINPILDTYTFKINPIIFEYYIDGKWITWDKLSDGTKRITYIINTVLSSLADQFVTDAFFNPILIEEPELGIHPHQLHLLMQFLKEQSKERQIIITTHSPQVLDILDKDELQNILISEMSTEGTKMRNMNAEEMKDAQNYLQEEDLLSAFWRFTDFNRN